MSKSRVVIFTDLDGTLLDHDTYSYIPVLPLLEKLARLDIPVIPVTSKTKVEVEQLRQDLRLNTPFVVENGAAVYFPESLGFQEEGLNSQASGDGLWCKAFSQNRHNWQLVLEKLRTLFPDCFKSFSDLGEVGIAEATGLSKSQARAANQREFSEPLLWVADENTKIRFIEALQAMGYVPLQGGRFVHITDGYDKGGALNWLMDRYRRLDSGAQWQSIALGDSHNDIAMLNAADHAVWVKSPVKDFPSAESRQSVYFTKAIGPNGWVEGIERLLFPDMD